MKSIINYLASMLTPALTIVLVGLIALPLWAEVLLFIAGVFVAPAILFNKAMNN